MAGPADIAGELEAKRTEAGAVLDWIGEGDDLVVGLGNSCPQRLLDAIEGHGGRLRDVRLHQMLPLRDRDYFHGRVEGLRHVSWFLGPYDREAFAAGNCDLVPNNFSEVPRLLELGTKRSLALVATAPPDRHGYFSLGCHGEYSAAMIGEVPFFVEANSRIPRAFGENQIHVSEVVGWCEADYPLIELPQPEPTDADRRIAAYVAERIPDGATIQAGIGSVPDQVLKLLREHSHLGIHTEFMGDALAALVECGAATGTRKPRHRNKAVTTSIMGSAHLYDFVAENPGVEVWPVDHTNDPRVIGSHRRMTAINATLEVDFLGQCASESLGSHYWSSSGGQVDFLRGALFSEEGQSFIVLHSSTHAGEISRIVPKLHPGAAVTSHKNTVDKVVTEHGVAELRGASIAERTRRLIAIADPAFREELEREARSIGYL